ncbi:MAG: 2-C-methyl-D-erythritol 2,4-cyclodiphosphate synthase [Phycisphaerales bacterium]|nr:2-C-methyl-D-erythritol 2,4-cyclodiphosphate synthase [Phycisphaerales bacterium]
MGGGPDAPPFRVGHGYDLHRLEPVAPQGDGRPFILGGVRIDYDRGPIGHSDGDALLHAITDAILGSIGEPDIGQLFPDSDSAHEGQDSRVFLAEACRRLAAAGYCIGNLDATVICQKPKLSAHKDAIRAHIAGLLGVGVSRVNVKGKTHEGVDAVGEQRAIEVHCVVLVRRI